MSRRPNRSRAATLTTAATRDRRWSATMPQTGESPAARRERLAALRTRREPAHV
ncbi:MAG: hypothetical protein K0R60_134 [Microbacterium sp.]|jgi:hypothetical protein|nr:hypothetical protein [Microbacterium sp.]